MYISCNKLKKYIEDPETIDWLKIWDTFTIRTAEVDGIIQKGSDMKDVVVAEITSCEPHPTKEKYHVLKVTDGEKEYDILCGAPNVKKGLKAPLVKVGGMVSGFEISEKKIAGVLSQGMLCAMDELGLGDGHEGILELPDDFPLGKDLKELLPIEDIVVEIDNKSLTNRPDLWGHYGIAREISAITGHRLLPLELYEVKNDKKDLDIKILDKELCSRYVGIKVSNIRNNKTPLDMQIFLYYAGMRSISLIVDLTNYLMLELGQPMHAFDSRVVKNIEIGRAKDNEKFITLDGTERALTSNMLMIKNNNEYFCIAGVMGGQHSEIENDTDSIILESANFDAASVRKTATALGLRTEASARYEKSLDPNMADVASKRFLKLLSNENPDLVIESNLTDIYPNKLLPKEVTLYKEKLYKYLNQEISDDFVKNTLESLSFKVKVMKDRYVVTAPTYRSTKDISCDADIIEEISRMFGYENVIKKPLVLDLTLTEHETIYNEEYKTKLYLADSFKLNEVNSYLWYDTKMLKELNMNVENVELVGKTENNILRDNLSLSLIPMVKDNFKSLNGIGIFEIGTVILNNENHRHLSVILADEVDNVETIYYKAKKIVVDLFKSLKHTNISFIKNDNTKDIYNKNYSYLINVDSDSYGEINIFANEILNYVGKKKAVVSIEIDFAKYSMLESKTIKVKETNKYQTVNLDYTILLDKDDKYSKIENVLKEFKNDLVLECKFIDCYEADNVNKYTIEFILGTDHTLSSKELNIFSDNFISFIKEKGLKTLE